MWAVEWKGEVVALFIDRQTARDFARFRGYRLKRRKVSVMIS